MVKELAQQLGVSQADVVEMAIRKFAERENER